MRSHPRRWIGGFGLIGLAAALCVALYPRERLLLAHARKIANVTGWKLEDSHYHWLSDQEILVYCDDPYANNSDWDVFFGFMAKHDLRTGKETPLHPFTQRTDIPPVQHNLVTLVTLSPDGKWLLWTADTHIGGSTLDGSRHILCPRRRWGHLAWMPDSRHWLELVENEPRDAVRCVLMHDVLTPQVVSYPVGRLSPDSLCEWTGASSNRILIASWDQGGPKPIRSVTILEVRLGAKAKPIRRFAVRLPQNSQMENIQFSLRGDRIAWIVKTTWEPSSLAVWMHRLFAGVQADWQTTFGCWVSDLNGGGMHEIGHVEPSGDRAYPDDVAFLSKLTNFRWLPDGKRLSFVYGDTLYTVPAE